MGFRAMGSKATGHDQKIRGQLTTEQSTRRKI